MKWLKFILYFILLLIVLIAITAAVFVATFDANAYKQELSDLVKQQTGRELSFSGDISLRLYPRLGMQLGHMQLSNAAGFGSKPFFAVDEVSVFVDVLSLLRLQPEIAELVLDGVSADLQKNAQGVTNWDDLLARFASPAAESESSTDTAPAPPSNTAAAAPAASEPASAEAQEPFELQGVFKGLRITNLNATWKDQQAGQFYQLQRLDLVTGEIRPNEAFDISLHVEAKGDPQIRAKVDLSTSVLFEIDKERLTLENLQLQTAASMGKDINAEVKLSSALQFDLKRQYLQTEPFKIAVTASGELIPVEQAKINALGELGFDLNTQQLSVKGFAVDANTSGGLMQSIVANVAGEIGMNLANMQLSIGVLEVSATATDPSLPLGQVQAQITAQQMDARLAQNQVDVQGLNIAVNDQRISGWVKANDFTVPDVAFDLHSDSFDLDKILGEPPPPVETPAEPETQDDTAADEPPADVEIALPMELLRSIKINGKLGIDALEAMNIRMQQFRLGVDAEGGIIDIEPLSMNLYDGSFATSVKLDARADEPVYQLDTELDGFQVGKFLIDFLALDKISGATELKFKGTTRGNWLSQLKQNLNGNVEVTFRNGALKGFNLRYLIDKAKAKFGGAEPDATTQQTDFTALSLSGAIRDGVFYSDDLSLLSPLIRVGGEGNVNLVKDVLDYTVKAKVVGSLTGQGGGDIDELSGLLIPVNISGKFTDPKINILIDDLMKEKARQALEAQKAQIKKATDAAKAAADKQIEAQKAKLAEEKARLKAENDAKLAAEKAKLAEQKAQEQARIKAELEAKKQAEQAALKAQQDAEKQRLQQELDAKKKAEEDKLKDKLKSLF